MSYGVTDEEERERERERELMSSRCCGVDRKEQKRVSDA